LTDVNTTHTHALCGVGTVISGYQVNESWHLMAKGNPRWPQVRLYQYYLVVKCQLNIFV